MDHEITSPVTRYKVQVQYKVYESIVIFDFMHQTHKIMLYLIKRNILFYTVKILRYKF